MNSLPNVHFVLTGRPVRPGKCFNHAPSSRNGPDAFMDIHSLWLKTQELWDMLDQHPWVRTGLALVLLLTAALVLGRVARFVVLYAVKMLGRQPSLHWVNDFRHNKVFHRLAQMVPSLVIQFGLTLVPGLSTAGRNVIGNIAMAFTILFMTLAIGTLLNALLDIYARTEHARTRSIKGYVQLSKMILYVFAGIIIVATLIDRSPLLLLSDVGGHPAGLQGHPALLRRQCAVDQQRHAARRRLDRNAAGRRGRRCGGHHPAHRQSAELRQNHRLHPHLALDVRVVPQLARHAAIRRATHQAQPVHRRQRRALRA
ncbi:MscS Mechanosensitive ion channel [Pseudomonas savastanoi pv. retacarpa]|nr:MscS Mechanosensitive ion channel [Pseudomonas savastanoi pv. retacarpa]RML30996.1 Mechanosensitive ion channel protein [Pseudomonas savastanoi pv. retacarpa]